MQCHRTREPSRHVVGYGERHDAYSGGLRLVIGHIVSVSPANILWRQRCARAGLEISRLGFAARGAILAPIVTAAGLAALSRL